MKLTTRVCVALGCMALSCRLSPAGEPAAVRVTRLKCEYAKDPLGIDVPRPRLSWQLESAVRGQRQMAYQVLVAGRAEDLAADKGELWDSGKVDSDQSVHVPYAGKELSSRTCCWWKVRVWDKDGRPSAWSAPAHWTMGLLEPRDWRGQWIGAPRADSVKAPPAAAKDKGGVLGYHAAPAKSAAEVKWVQVDLGKPQRIDRVVLHPLNHDGVKGFGFPLRFRVDVAGDAAFKQAVCIADQSASDYPTPGLKPVSFEARGAEGRYVRVTVSRLWQRPHADRAFCFGLAEMEVLCGAKNVALNAAVTAKDSTEGYGWSARQLTDGQGLAGPPLGAAGVPPATPGGAAGVPPPGPPTGADARGSPDPPDAALLLRKEVALDKPIKRALACMVGLGLSELYINGKKADDRVLSPAFTDYTKRVLYVMYDVTGLLQHGRNAVGVILGNGFYSLPSQVSGWCRWYWRGRTVWGDWPKLLLDIHVEFADGSSAVIKSDTTWKWSTGDITWNCLWTGEKGDRRLAKPGWGSPGYDDGKWRPVVEAAAPAGQLRAQQHRPIRVYESVPPASVTGNVFDFGAIYTGWLRLKTSGAPGQKITVSGGPPEEFILAGGGEEVLEPRFTLHTIRQQVTVEGLTAPATKGTLTVQRVGADLETAGEFACSNEFFNELHTVLLRTHRNYNFDHPLDPTREYSGWTQDVQTMFDSAVYLTDVATLYAKWWRDMADNQDAGGYLGSVVPFSGQLHDCNCVWWSGMVLYTPWLMWQYYGDRRMLEESYEHMQRYLAFLATKAEDHIVKWGLGDWLEVGAGSRPRRTPVFLTSTCGYHHYATIASRTAQLLGKNDEAKTYAQLAKQIRDSFNRQHLDPQTGFYAKCADSQTAQMLPLHLGLVADDKRPLVKQRLIENIHQRKDHLSTGFIGTPFLLPALAEMGEAELAYTIANQRDFPGWGTVVQNGVMKENWAGGQVQMPSCAGAIGAFLYQVLAGIRPDPDGPGFRKIIIRPEVVGDLKWVKARYDSIRGPIAVHWEREGQRLTLDLAIPPNTTATVYVPGEDAGTVTEGGRLLAQAEGVRLLRAAGGKVLLSVESGQYRFTSTLK